MKLNLLVSAAMIIAALASVPAIAEDNDGAVREAAGGAVTGAIVGGPVGAAVGGVAGAIVGTALDPPPREVVAYVEHQPIPADAVVVEETSAVGKSLPKTVVLTPVPEHSA